MYRERRRRWKFGSIEITGLVFLFLTLLMLVLAARNFWVYSRMRNFDARVTASSLRIDVSRGADSDHPNSLVYLLKLDLKSEDGSERSMRLETDAGKAAYPEEAVDELAIWAPGTRHRIQTIRGDSRAIRIASLEGNPELESGIGGLIAAMLFGMVALTMLAGLAEEHALFKRFAWRKHLGVWTVFFGFGLLPLIGWFFFTFSHVRKMWTWNEVIANRIEARHKFSPDTLPAGVQLAPAAKARLDETSYELIEYEWMGHKVRGGIGHLDGVHDRLGGGPDGRYRFRIDPLNRWELSAELGWNEDFWVPFGALLFFGLAFCGAGLVIKKTSPGF